MSLQVSAEKIFEDICNSQKSLNNFSLFHITGSSGSGELALLDKLKKEFAKTLFLITPQFKIEYLWSEGESNSKDSFDAHLTNKIKENDIIICENWFSTDLQLLQRFYEIIVYCYKSNMKKIFILNCTVPFLDKYDSHCQNLNLLIQSSIPCFSYTLQPLSDLCLKKLIEEDDVFKPLSNNCKEIVVAWSNGNEIFLKEIMSSLKDYSSATTQKLSSIIEENKNNTIIDVYDRLYRIVISSLTEKLSKTLDLAIVSGMDIYTDILKELDCSYIVALLQIEQSTHILKIKSSLNRVYTFANETIYNVLKKRISKNVITEYSLILIDTIARILNQGVSAIPKIILLEKINDYLEYSINEYYKQIYCNQLIDEYFQNQMYNKCLNLINLNYKLTYSQLKNKHPDIALKLLVCLFRLESYSKCIEILKKKKKLTAEEKLIYLQSYYQIGNPKKVIKLFKSINTFHWNNKQKIQLYSLLVGCYEWEDKHNQLVKFYDKSFKLASLEKNEEYYQLLRKSNITIDSSLPEYTTFMNEAIKYFERKKDFKSCAWCLHNWGTEQLLNLKEINFGFEKLTKAKQFLEAQLSIDRFDVENSLAIYYMLNREWKLAYKVLKTIQDCSNMDFCNIAYKLNMFHCLRKLNMNEESETLLIEIDTYFQNKKLDSTLRLQWQNYCVSKGLSLLDKNREKEALSFFIKAIKCMSKDYKSYYSYIAAKNILMLSSKSYNVKTDILKLAEYFGQSIEPICIKLNEENITIAEIMFWS